MSLLLGYLPNIVSQDPYLRLKVVRLPFEVAKRRNFEEQVTDIKHNGVQEVVDK
jgi:hypothetical protein